MPNAFAVFFIFSCEKLLNLLGFARGQNYPPFFQGFFTDMAHPFQDSVKKVLLVEDDLELLTELQDFLMSHGQFDVIARENGIEALETLKKNPRIDIIVSDYLMVGKGSDLAKAAVEMGVPVIIITGNYDEAVKALKLYSLKVPVLKKPFNPFKLAELIDHYLSGKPVSNSPVLAAWWNDMN